MKKLYTLFLLAFVVTSTINAQKTLVTENFGGSYAHNESMSTNSSGWTHTGAGDFVHKIVSGSGASGSNCFAQLGASGATSASHDIQLLAGNTYEFKAYVKTVNSRIYVTLRINSGGTDVATSGNTSANGSWEELSCSYTPSADEMASFQFVKTQGQLANIDKIKVICTSCPDKNYVFDFNDSKEGWLSGGGCNVSLGNDAMNINASGNNVLVRSGNTSADLGLTTTDYDRARVTFKTPYNASGAGAGKLYFYSLSGGNSQFAVFDITRDAANTTTFQTVEIDLTSTPTSGAFTGGIARLGFRTPWGIASGDICNLQKVELYNQPTPVSALTLTGIMDIGLSGSSGKALMLTANQSISDLSSYGIGTANNGGGTDGQEYTFPAVSVSAGQHVVLCRDQAALSGYFSGCLEQFNGALFPTVIIESSSEPSGNGNDAYELFHNGNVIETFGDINSSAYTYRDSWAWKDTAAANVGNWVYGGNDCSDNSSSTQTSNCPFPLATTACVATYDVTLKVNTANITVGANGMYAGGGFLGGSDALQLTDADGDGTWEGVATISAGSGPNYYAFFNSPNSGSDWGTKEDLAGQTCGISSNYNDRVLPTITSDTTIQHCYGNCAFDGTCNPPVTPTYDLTLSVNTAGITVGSNGMYAGGGVLGDAMAVQLFDADGDGTWTGTVTMNTGVTGNYIFLNSPSHGGDWGTKEDLTGLACSDPANYNDRILPVIISDTTMLHCFGSCETDGTCPAPPSVFFNVTFQVDASNITVGSNGIYAGGGVLGDAMAYPLSDADGDGVWEATISLADGTTGNYIFLNSPSNGGDWGAKEDLTGLSCADPANWNDRILPAVTADVTIPYCFGTCDATCPTPPGCYYTVAMVDSWGDGWNGGSIDVSVGGNVVANWTIVSGSSATDSIYTNNGDNVSFNWNGGSYDSEVSFTITDPAGTTIYTGGAPPAGSNFLSDVSVSSCQPSPVNITFQVDMGQVTSTFTTPEINGSWNNWAGASNQMTDADGDNVWEGTISLLPGSYEYKFAADNWASQETNDPNAPCTNGDPVYTNRTLVVGNADATLSAVCWGSCDPCVYAPVAGTCGFFNLELTDSYGDGWNGGTMDVVVNGNTVFAGLTIVTGNGPDVYQIPVDIGDVVDFNYTAGSWSGENAYQVFDQNGSLIVDQGANNTTPSSVTGVSACPACPEPTGLTALNITSNSADLSWTPGGSEAEWYVIINGTGTSVASASYTATGLVANTLYNCAVHAICAPGDTSVAASTFSFTTPCGALTAPIVETFDNGMPSCWSEYQTSGSGWVFSGNPGYVAGSNGRPSGTYAWIDFSGTDVGATLEGPSVDVSALIAPQLRFNYFSANTNNTSVNELYVETFDGTNWNAIDTIAQLNPGWEEHTADLSASVYNNTLVKVRFRAESGGASTDFYSDILLDDVEFRETPSCQNPGSLSASNVTNSSLDFGWAAGGTETAWNVEYGSAGFTLGTGTLTAVTSNPTNISGLTGNTSYDLYVQADCGASGVSPWAGPITVTTLCDPFAAPFAEGFSATLPSCWSMSGGENWLFNTTGPNHVGNGGTLSGSTSSGGHYAVVDASGYSGASGSSYLTTPFIDISSLTAAELTFFLISNEEGTGYSSTLTVEAHSGSAWDTVGSYTGNTNGWEQKVIDLSSYQGTIQLRFAFSEQSASGAYFDDIAIDDVDVHETPSCPASSGLVVSNITTSSADLSWTAGGTETAWNVEYGTAGFTLGTGTLTPTAATTLSMTSLTDLTSYDVYVQSDCGSGQTSSWVGPLTFNTQIANGCNHTLNMFDSYGDGWNGSAVDVTVNGVTVVSGATIPNGSTATASFSASTGSTVALANWVTGSWTTEVSWNITDVNGTVIANGVFSDTPSVGGNCQSPSFNDPLIGTWKLAQVPGAMGVGPNQGDVSWWSSSLGDVTSRACLFDDSIHFDSTGGYTHFMDGNTWVEGWQDGAGDGCRAPVAPHDGLGSYNYYYDSSTNTLTLNGLGAHLGLPKVTNTGEINNPQLAASAVSYVLTFSNNGNTMTADIDFGGGWWRFVYDNTSYQAPPSSYNVTLKVNTATITVGPNGMYAGGGVLGDAMAVPLSDADGDGTWEATTQFPVAGGHYVFLNSPSNGGDWGAKEDLTGLPCGDPNSYNDRLMPSIASDTTVLHCFGSCETDGSCPAPPPVPSCNYTIDMQDSYGDGWNGASIDVAVNGTTVANWSIGGAAGSDSIATINGDIVDFTFNSGSWDSEITFQITDPTGSQLGSYGPSPAVGLFLTDTSAAICQPTTVNVTFQVDMGQVTAAFTTPEVNGSWNNWSAGTAMTDANGDGIWDATVALLSGNYEYKFAADGWTIQEMNDPNAPCTNGDPIYTNRVLAVGTVDMVIPNVCWGSCTPCFYSPQPPAGLTCTAGNAGLGFSDDIVPANGWSGDLGGNGYWNVGSGGTPSGSTGPTGAHSGPDYLFFESSTGGLDTATAVTPMIDLTAATADAELTFWMHAYGAAIGTLDVGVSTSATGPFTSVFNSTGAVQTPSDPWAQIGINIATYVGQQIYVGFTYARDTTGAISYQGDLAIDLVEVHACFNCLAPSGLTASNVTGSSADVSWTAGGSETEWFLIVNGAGTTQTSTTASLTGLMSNTAYTCQVHAVCAPGDTSAASPAMSFNTLCNVAMAPTNETFDAGFSNCWSQETADDFDWTVDAGGTPSGGTGPSDDFTGGGNYMYTEASVPRAYGDVATMYSEVIDISALTNPELRFLNHMYGNAMGTLSVDLWDAGTGTNLGTVFTHSGDRGDVWNEELIMLSTTASTVQFSITAVLDSNAGGQSWPGDMAIDEFGVREAAANDLALVAAAVASGCDLTATEPIELWVLNQGLVAESSFDLSYAVNGGTPVVESITSTVNPGDTLKYVFTATADMTADGVYDLDFACVLATDNDPADNTMMLSAENYYTPMAPASTMGDTICNGDTAYIGAVSDGYVYWYDANSGGNLVGEGDYIDVMPTTTTSYYAEAAASEGHFEDFDSYNSGDFIAASDPNNWATWSGTSADDMPISDVQGNGGNSLRVFNSDGSDVVLEFGEAFSTGKFYYAMDMYMVADGYINFQEQVTIGAAWNMSITFIGGVINIDIDGASVLTGSYPTTPTGGPMWNNFEFECDYSTGTWEVFTNGTSQGTFVNADPVASVNIYPGAGVEYYLDNVEWGALKDDACRSASRTEAVVTVEDCSNINELAKGNLDIYPNPNNGLFTISNSEDIVKVTVTDVHGKIVQSINEINLNKIDVDLTNLERGMYMINVETNNGTVIESVIVQ